MARGRRLLVTGGSGFLGRLVCSLAIERGWTVSGTYLNREVAETEGIDWIRLDLRDDSSVRETLDRARPEVLIHTAYRQDESEVTFGGTRRLAGACAALARPPRFLQVSTDLVFDGTRGMYSEEDEARPVLGYGRDKLDAELAVRESLPDSLIVRAALLYDLERIPSHLGFALDALRKGREFSFFTDEFRSPLLAAELAGALLDLGERAEAGTLHVAGADRVDRWWFGRRLMMALGLDWRAARPASFRNLGLVRPADCSMRSDRAGSLLGTRFRGAREVLAVFNPDGEG